MVSRVCILATDIVPSDVNFWQSEKLVAIWTGLYHFFESKVHPGIAANQVAIEGFSIFELDQHGMALCGIE